MRGHYFPLFIFLFFIPFNIAFANDEMLFKNIDSRKGLSDNNVRTIFQLPDGRIAAFTEGLLNIYNASFFQSIHTKESNVYMLKDYEGYHRAYIGDNDHIWIKDFKRLYLFDIRSEKYSEDVQAWLANRGVKEPLANFFMDTSHNYWLLTVSGRLYTIPNQASKAIYVLNVYTDFGLVNSHILDLTTHANDLYIYCSNGEVKCINLATKKLLPIAQPFHQIERKQFTKIGIWLPQKEGILLLTNGDKGALMWYDYKAKQWTTLLKKDYWLSTMAISKQQDLFISCQYGVWYYEAKTKQWKLWEAFSLIGDKCLKASINSVFIDIQDGLWLGTTKNGLLYQHKLVNNFKIIPYTAIDNKAKDNFKVNAIAQYKNALVLGTTEGLYLENKGYLQFQVDERLTPKDEIYQLTPAWNTSLLINASKNGLYVWRNEQQYHYDFNKRHLFYVYPLQENTVLVNFGEGLEVHNLQNKKVQVTPTRLGVVYQMAAFPQTNKLIGIADEGVFLYDKNTHKLEITNTLQAKRPLYLQQKNNRYTCLFTDSRSLLWMGTWDGLSVWDASKQSLRLFHTENGLANCRIQSITEDRYGDIWVSTAAGISQIQIHKKQDTSFGYKFFNYSNQDGVMFSSFEERAVYNTPAGQLIWAGQDGLNILDVKNPQEYAQRNRNQPILTKLFVQGKMMSPKDTFQNTVVLRESIATTKFVKFPYNQNSIGFEFASLQFGRSSGQTFYVQLEGADSQPIAIQTENGLGRISYNNLAPGKYYLYIYASEAQKPDQAILKIEIRPAPWASSMAYTVYVLLLIGLVVFVVILLLRRRHRQLENKHAVLLEQAKLNFYTHISHELKTPISLILAPLQLLLQKQRNAEDEQHLKTIQGQAESLLKMVGALLDFRKVSSDKENLNLSYTSLSAFFKPIIGDFSILFKEKNIDFTYTLPQEDISFYLDNDKLQKVFNNILINAYKFTAAGGRVALLVGTDSSMDMIKVSIIDSGIGIEEESLGHIFDAYYQGAYKHAHKENGSGIGLYLSKKYVELHQGQLRVSSVIGQGTQFEICLPLNLSYKRDGKEVSLLEKTDTPFKVLLVEDNKDLRDFLGQQLSLEYEVQAVANGGEALLELDAFVPDLVVSDIMMPVLDGISLCQHIKGQVETSHIPVVLLSALSNTDKQKEGYLAKADAYLDNPFQEM